ncbi:MAG: transposase [Deltaproteobacteria bacterium]|nr:transposase [Deltaproteobacteria bacterium]
MSQTLSPSTNRPYGLALVCRAWCLSRATVYRRRASTASEAAPVLGKRGPKQALSDEALLSAIRKDIESTVWVGEGHRKVWARLRHGGVRTSLRRVLRLMRGAGLLSPGRPRRQLGPRVHDGTIIPDAPNQMWGTDGTGTVTQEDGHVTLTGTGTFLGKFTSPTEMTSSMVRDNGTGVSINYPIQTSSQLFVYRQQQTANGDGQHTIFGYRDRDSYNAGTGYGNTSTNSGVAGMSFWGDDYSFGVTGHNYTDFLRTGGVLGGEINGTYWGALGYKASNSSRYGVYGSTAAANGAGRRTDSTARGIGGGFYGDLMGGWVRGEVMGLVSSGQMFASYNHGNAYTAGKNVELVKSASGRMTPAFAVTSTDSKVYANGRTRLRDGSLRVSFDPAYVELLAAGEVPTVTLTPVGGWANLYVARIDRKGFTVAEANGGKANIEVNWVAIGQRAGEQTAVPEQVASGELNAQLEGVMHNEGLTQQSGRSIWWDGKRLRFDAPPATKRPEARR